MGKIGDIRLKNITEALESTDVFAVYRDKTWIPVQGLRFDDLIFGDPTVLEANLQINGYVKSEAFIGNRYETSSTESVDVQAYTDIKQTASGISTTLTNAVDGSEISVFNGSGGSNTIIGTINGDVDPTIYDCESFTMIYDGTNWNLK